LFLPVNFPLKHHSSCNNACNYKMILNRMGQSKDNTSSNNRECNKEKTQAMKNGIYILAMFRSFYCTYHILTKLPFFDFKLSVHFRKEVLLELSSFKEEKVFLNSSPHLIMPRRLLLEFRSY